MSDNKNKDKNNVINIQKFKPQQTHEFTKEEMPWTLICNKVIDECTNPMAGFIWIYLQSKPPIWKPCKWEIMKRFNISERTYQRHMSYLSATNLIENLSTRNPDGTVAEWRIRVLNGSKFNPAADAYKGTQYSVHINHTAKNGVVEEAAPHKDSDHTAKNGELDFIHTAKNPHSGEMATYINTRSTNLKKKERDLNTLGDSANTPKVKDFKNYQDDLLFTKFYSHYPNKQKPREAYKAFLKLKPTEELVAKLLEDINKRLAKDKRWQSKQYIPYPATYLNSCYWEGDVITAELPKAKYNTPQERERLKESAILREQQEEKAKEEERQIAPRVMSELKKKISLKAMLEELAKQKEMDKK